MPSQAISITARDGPSSRTAGLPGEPEADPAVDAAHGAAIIGSAAEWVQTHSRPRCLHVPAGRFEGDAVRNIWRADLTHAPVPHGFFSIVAIMDCPP